MNPESLMTSGSMAWRPAQKETTLCLPTWPRGDNPTAARNAPVLVAPSTVAQKEPDLFNKSNADLYDTFFLIYFFNQMLMFSP